MTEDEKKRIFNEHYETLERLINRKRKHFKLAAVPSLSFDDVFQKIALHVYKYIHTYKSKKGKFEPWAATIIENQWKNILRDNYLSFKKPCAGCPYNDGDMANPESCSFTPSGKKSPECKDYAKWSYSIKRDRYNVKLPLPIENQTEDLVYHNPKEKIEAILHDLGPILRKRLRKTDYKFFRLFYLEKKDLNETAKEMGWGMAMKNNRPKYKRSAEQYNKRIIEEARRIVNEEGKIDEPIEKEKLGSFIFEKPEIFEQLFFPLEGVKQ